MQNLDALLDTLGPSDAVQAIDEVIIELCQYGTDIKKLNESQKIFYYVVSLMREVGNGGIGQFFENGDGDYSHEALQALRDINAPEKAAIIQKAIEFWPDHTVPNHPGDREEIMEGMDEEVFERWDQLDQEFYASKEDLPALLITYVRAHKEDF